MRFGLSVLSLFTVLLMSCNTVKRQNVDAVMLNWSDYKVSEWTDSTINSNVLYVVLKSGDGKAYFKTIEKVLVYEDNLYILDALGRKIIRYDMDGNPVAVLHKVGRGPGEYIHLDDFCIDSSGHIFTLDCSRSVITEYDRTFCFCNRWQLEFAADQIAVLPDNGFALSLSPYNSGKFKDVELVLASADFSDIIPLAYYDSPVSTDEVISLPLISSSSYGVIYHRTVTDYLYKIGDGGKLERLAFDFGKNTVPMERRENLSENLDYYSSYITLLQCYAETSDKIYGMLYRFGVENIFVLDKTLRTVSFQETNNPFYSHPEERYGSFAEYPIGVSDRYMITCIPYQDSGMAESSSGNISGDETEDLMILCLYDISR